MQPKILDPETEFYIIALKEQRNNALNEAAQLLASLNVMNKELMELKNIEEE